MDDVISLARGVPAPETLPEEELADCARVVLEREGKALLSYGPSAGYTPLRALIAEWFGVHPYRILLTNGSLQGLWLLGRRFARGHNVVVEWPTYDRALRVLLDSGASLLAAVVDDDGMNIDDLDNILMGQSKPAFVYTIPTFQNPTGRTLPPERRARMVEVLGRREIIIVEDDPYSLIRFEGEPLPAVFDYTGKNSIYMSSFSKTIAPGLRVGWMILPESAADELTEDASATYITPSLLSQAIAYEFITRGSFEPALRRMNEQMRLRRDAMLAALAKYFPDGTWTRPEGGYFVWLQMPFEANMPEVLERAKGVTAVLGSEFSAPTSFVRLAYSYASPDEIEEGVRRLAAAM
jgi:DNA-binding transcriptional MocR family regulator